jgi:hypothetical protein
MSPELPLFVAPSDAVVADLEPQHPALDDCGDPCAIGASVLDDVVSASATMK